MQPLRDSQPQMIGQKDETNHKQHGIGVSSKKAKTATERSREFRARKRLLEAKQRKQQLQQQSDSDLIGVLSSQDDSGALISKKKKTSAERTRRWRERKEFIAKRIRGKSKAKSSAERSREYRQRKKNKGHQTHTHLDNLPSTSNRESQYIKIEPVDHDSNQMVNSTQENHSIIGVSKEEVILSDGPFDGAQTVHSNVDFTSLADSSVSTDIGNYIESKFMVGFQQSDHPDEDKKGILCDQHFLRDASNRECTEPKGTDNSKRKNDSGNESNTPTKKHCHVIDFRLFRREDFKEESTWNRFLDVLEDMKRENLSLQHENEYLRDKLATYQFMRENGKEEKCK